MFKNGWMHFYWSVQYTSKLDDQQQFRLNKINEVKDYFVAEIKGTELMSKRLSKYSASCDNFDKFLVVLSATSGSISIASFATVVGAPVGIASAHFNLAFTISTGIVEKLLKTMQNKKKKHNKIVLLARSRLESIISETIIMKLVVKILWQLLTKKETIEN